MKWLDTDVRFSEDRKHRYMLSRTLQGGGKRCLFIMLNPSTADESKNDPTVERCCRYTLSWGYDVTVVCNLFGLRSTNPQQLYHHDDPIGFKNDFHILKESDRASIIICAWGVHGALTKRGQFVINHLLDEYELHCLGLTKDGLPRHPLYLKKDLKPILMERRPA